MSEEETTEFGKGVEALVLNMNMLLSSRLRDAEEAILKIKQITETDKSLKALDDVKEKLRAAVKIEKDRNDAIRVSSVGL